jgi:hypothetical protein
MGGAMLGAGEVLGKGNSEHTTSLDPAFPSAALLSGMDGAF